MGVTIILLIEIFFRWISSWRTFHSQKQNLVDLVLAIITTVMLFPVVRDSGRPYDWLTLFQILRIYRVVWAIPVTRDLLVCSDSCVAT